MEVIVDFAMDLVVQSTHWPYSPVGTPASASTYNTSPDEYDDAVSYDLWGGEYEPYIGPPADPSLGGPAPGVKWFPARSDTPMALGEIYGTKWTGSLLLTLCSPA